MYYLINNIIEIKSNKLLKKTGNNIHVLIKSGQKIKLLLKNVTIPFGLEYYKYKKLKKFFLKLNINEPLSDQLKDLENDILDQVNDIYMLNLNVKSQIIYKSNYKNQLIVKFKEFRNKIQTKITNQDKNSISLFEIKEKDKLDIEISPNAFIYNDDLIIKWTIITLNILR
jgi:hypothetical protein